MVEAAARTLEEVRLFLVTAVDSGAIKREPPSSLLKAVDRFPKEVRYRQRWAVLDALGEDLDRDFLETGVDLAVHYRVSGSLYCSQDGTEFDREVVDKVVAKLSDSERGEAAMSLWRASTGLPSLMEHLRALPLEQVPQEALSAYIGFIGDLDWYVVDEPSDPDRRQALVAHLPAVLELLISVPTGFAAGAAANLAEVIEPWRAPEESSKLLPSVVSLFQRIQRPPFDPDAHYSTALASLLKLGRPYRERIFAAPFSSFQRLSKACRRKYRGELAGWGIDSLAKVAPDLVVEAFERETASLVRIAKTLAAFNDSEQHRVLRAWLETDAGPLDANWTVSELVAWADRAAPDHGAVPKALRKHLSGQSTLSEGSIERHRKKVLDRAVHLRLKNLENAVDARLGRPVGQERPQGNVRFALQMLADTNLNRRGLRRFLRAYGAGDTDYLAHHQANQSWLHQHPRLNCAAWLEGLERRGNDQALGDVVLNVEQDPFEILKMGAHVGSCLSLGGGFSYSAIAVLLDVNKQVIYARDSRGTALARQLLAISPEEKLVPFYVYPEAPPSLQRAFRDYDLALAEALGIEIDFDGEVDLVLSQRWWHDGGWTDFEIQEGS
ncbi:MAG: hypothetical protein AAF690_18250 [Acidobacteriota bacterium]